MVEVISRFNEQGSPIDRLDHDMSHRDDFLTFLNPSGVRTSALPIEFCILITDTLQSPGLFIETHLIHRALRDQRSVLLLGLSQGLNHYSSILRKNGIQLNNEQRQGRFAFVDGGRHDNNNLVEILDATREAIQRLGPTPLVLVDELSCPLWAGNSSGQVSTWFMALRALVSGAQGSLVVLLHADDTHTSSPNEDLHLFRRVLQQSDLWLQTTSLSSQTRGELSIHRGPALIEDYGIIQRSGPTAWHYKLDESGATFSLKGLGTLL
ncbi:BQ2448_1165 [Microbotryum intermedium]|uniref:BQ2448_1165 protein n=1 Tax=Microbotryum intermedium TaxID=269621 RepID=A0A238FCD2_9BASI|nr:BQ2448_1165 [Microbotryum intermedium]